MSLPRVVLALGKVLGEALIAGVGMEIAKVAGEHMKKRVGPKKTEAEQKAEDTAAENERLKAEVTRLREELLRARGSPAI
ncbi:MAG TPA: hypothetical protein VGO62_07065 [Myxococcota bacterium]|jgi:hypothetical protein